MGLRMRLEWPVIHMVRLPNDMLLLAYIVKKKRRHYKDPPMMYLKFQVTGQLEYHLVGGCILAFEKKKHFLSVLHQ